MNIIIAEEIVPIAIPNAILIANLKSTIVLLQSSTSCF